jgi:tripartite-type tricarboxylate transporter receptor subunit TctC
MRRSPGGESDPRPARRERIFPNPVTLRDGTRLAGDAEARRLTAAVRPDDTPVGRAPGCIALGRSGSAIAATAVALALAFAASTGSARAQDFPTRPVTLIMPWGAGGGDVVFRTLADAAGRYLGQPIVVENRPGAGGTLAPEQMAMTAKPDGYTISQLGPPVFRAPFVRKTAYDPRKDFTYIIAVTGLTTGVAVRSNAPWKTFQEFLADAKAHPGKINYGSAGVGTNPQVAMERIAHQQGIRWVHIPYKTTPELVNALLGGYVDAITDAAGWAPQVDAGQFRLLVTGGASRTANWPMVPTLKEAGIDIVANAPNGIGGPAGMDPKVVKALHDAFRAALQDPSVLKVTHQFAQDVYYLSSQDYHDFAMRQIEEEKRVVEELGLQVE